MATVLRRALLLLATACAVGCGSKPREPEPVPSEPTLPVAPAEALTVEHVGCTVSTRTPATCMLRGRDRSLRLWIDAVAQPTVEIDGVASTEAPVRVGAELDGWRATVKVPAGAQELTVRTAGAAWRMALRDAPAMPVLDAIEAKLPEPTDPGRSAALVGVMKELGEALPKTTGLEHARLLRLASILSWDLGKSDDAIAYGRKAITAAIDADAASVAIDVAQNLAHFLADKPGDVEWLLELQNLYMPVGGDANLQVRWHYARAYQAFDAGELGHALTESQRCESLARRVASADAELAAASLEVSLLALLGRQAELRRAIERIIGLADARSAGNACQDAAALSGVAWSLLQGQTTAATRDDSTRLLNRSLQYFEPGGGCAVGDNPDWARVQQYARFYHAFAALLQGELVALRDRLAWFDDAELAPELQSWQRYLAAESALAAGQAAEASALLREVGPDPGDPFISWRTIVLRARSLERTGRRREALATYLQSEAQLDQLVEHVAVDQGREGVGVGMHAGAAGAIALLLGEGRTEEAWKIARLSRTRALRPAGRTASLSRLSPTARRRYHDDLSKYRELSGRISAELTELWRLPADERAAMLRRHELLRDEMRSAMNHAYAQLATRDTTTADLSSPSEHEVWLLYHPSEHGWFGFAATSDRIVATELGPPPLVTERDALARWLLEPFDSQLAEGLELHVLAMGALLEVSFEHLPRAHGTLLSERAVAYALDQSAPVDGTSTNRALVVGDPDDRSGSGELLRAHEEAVAVQRELERHGYTVELLSGRNATHAAVLGELERVDWFHHAGHGTREGVAGWDSALPLAGEARLSVRDIVALARAPRAVVLSACETAALAENTADGGMHVARAFLLAGSTFVIASQGAVDDDVAAKFATELYRRSRDLRGASGPQLLRTTALALDATEGPVGLPFHVWIP